MGMRCSHGEEAGTQVKGHSRHRGHTLFLDPMYAHRGHKVQS